MTMTTQKTPFEDFGYIASTTGREVAAELQYRIPVVFVPGIMGSRLVVANGTRWEPDDRAVMWEDLIKKGVKERRRLMHTATQASYPQDLRHTTDAELWRVIPPSDSNDGRPVSSIAPPDGYHRAIQNGERQRARQMIVNHARERFIERGWNEVVWEHYGHFLLEMEAHNIDLPYAPEDPDGGGFRGGDCPVYAVGYDWRQSNVRSAARLRHRLTEIIEREGERAGLPTHQVVLATHSMGGLVARSYLHQFPSHAEEHVAGVVHLNQPTYGAPVLYRRLKTGAQTEHEFSMSLILDEWDEAFLEGGGTPVQTTTMVSAFPSVAELLPGRAFDLTADQKERFGPSWLGWEATLLDANAEEGTLAYAGRDRDLFDVYLEESGQVGLVPPGLPTAYAEEMRRHVLAAGRFQSEIEETFHPYTFWLASEGVRTDHVVRIVHQGLKEDLIGLYDDLTNTELVPFVEDSDPHFPAEMDTVLYHHDPSDGDGTVPHFSQVGSGGEVETISGVKHAAAAGAPETISQAKRWVQRIVDRYVEEQT